MNYCKSNPKIQVWGRPIDALNLQDLCIVKGESCWLLNIDVLYIQCGGNLFDGGGAHDYQWGLWGITSTI